MIGRRVPRLEDARLVAGKGRYTDDIRPDNQVYAVFVRSPHAHAWIKGIDTTQAAGAPGVLAVLTGQDYAAGGFRGIDHLVHTPDAVRYTEPTFKTSLTGHIFDEPHMPLPTDKARHVGQAVAVVIANSRYEALDAAEIVAVDYEPIDPVAAIEDAVKPGAPRLWDQAPGNLYFQTQLGDKDAAVAAFRNAHLVVRRDFKSSRIVNCQMEPRSVIAEHNPASGAFTITTGCQGAHRVRAAVANALGVTNDKVRVICPDVGGGFGPRTLPAIEQVVVPWAAMVVGRPVKWTSDRSEAFLADYQGRDALLRGAMALDADGRILAIDHEWYGNVGGNAVSYVPLSNGTRIITTVYRIPVMAVLVSAVATNTVSTGPYRGAGRPEATHLMERLLDVAAKELGLDALEVRRRNILTKADLPYVTPTGLTYDSGDFLGNMELAVEVADWAGFGQRQKESESRGRLRGIGIGNYVEAPVGALRERVELTVLHDGSVDLIAGSQSTGQGHETVFAQVVSARLGTPLSRIRLRTGDTALVKLGGGTHSDRSMRIVGTLLMQACDQVISRTCQALAHKYEVGLDCVAFAAGCYEVRKEAEPLRIRLEDIAAELSDGRVSGNPLHAEVEFEGRIPAHPTGVAVCELEVDPEIGSIEICHYTSVDDSGQIINPLIVHGQMHGGLAQGLGQALYEGFHVDRSSGQVLTGSYMDYGVPRAGCIPVDLRLREVEDPTSGNPLRVKGGGEGGTIPATACVFNALAHAFRGFTDREPPMPATPGAIWDFLRSAGYAPGGSDDS